MYVRMHACMCACTKLYVSSSISLVCKIIHSFAYAEGHVLVHVYN